MSDNEFPQDMKSPARQFFDEVMELAASKSIDVTQSSYKLVKRGMSNDKNPIPMETGEITLRYNWFKTISSKSASDGNGSVTI